MRGLYEPVTDAGTTAEYVNLHPWWRDPQVLSGIGELLAEPFLESAPTVVVAPPASGFLLGPLVATHLGVGFATVRKNPARPVDSDPWIIATTPPDYQDRHLTLGIRKGSISSSDRVLVVDDIADTGSQLTAIQKIVSEVGAAWLGVSLVVDLMSDSGARRRLGVKSVFRNHDL